MPTVFHQNPLWGDFSGPSDYHQSLEQIQLAQDRYNELPADVRTASQNDPEIFLQMIESDDRALLEEAGLIISTNPTSDPIPLPPSGEKEEDVSASSD